MGLAVRDAAGGVRLLGIARLRLWDVPLADVLAEWDQIDKAGTDLAGIRALCLEDRYYLLVKAAERSKSVV